LETAGSKKKRKTEANLEKYLLEEAGILGKNWSEVIMYCYDMGLLRPA